MARHRGVQGCTYSSVATVSSAAQWSPAAAPGWERKKAWTWRVPPWTIIVVADVYAPHAAT